MPQTQRSKRLWNNVTEFKDFSFMQNPARRHHYVSQFYLKGFAADPNKPVLYVVNLLV